MVFVSEQSLALSHLQGCERIQFAGIDGSLANGVQHRNSLYNMDIEMARIFLFGIFGISYMHAFDA
jgi:hypothetical protein